jgi:hypothetical protein
VGVVTTTGVATAFWTVPGLGAGTAGTATTQPVVLGPGTPTASLRPGGRSDVALVLTNPNAAAVTVPSLVLDTAGGTGGFAVDAAHAGCAPASFAFAAPAPGAGWEVPAHGTAEVVLTDAVLMVEDAADACQGVTATVHLRAGS